VDAHGGEVLVTSAVGVGTTFEIVLPLAPAAVPAHEPVSTQPASSDLMPASAHSVGALDADGRELDV